MPLVHWLMLKLIVKLDVSLMVCSNTITAKYLMTCSYIITVIKSLMTCSYIITVMTPSMSCSYVITVLKPLMACSYILVISVLKPLIACFYIDLYYNGKCLHLFCHETFIGMCLHLLSETFMAYTCICCHENL